MSNQAVVPLPVGPPLKPVASPGRESNLRLALRGFYRLAIMGAFCLWGALSGWWQLWPLLIMLIVVSSINLLVILVWNPSLLHQRLKAVRPVKRWDNVLVGVSQLFLAALVIVAWADVHHFHSALVPSWGLILGAGLLLVGDAICAWCMAKNPFLDRNVKVQPELGHYVIATGPYCFVRHPMYAGIIIATTGITLMLGSFLALIPALAVSAAIVMRTYYEDRTLDQELDGYRGYMARTRYRLLPWVW